MNRSEKFWDKMANDYDREEKKDELTYIKIIEKTKKYLKISDIVLDYGCRTGLISNEIADNVKVIHAIDASSKMIEIAKRKADGRKIENIDYSQSTIFDEKYKRGSFDVILVFYILHLLEDTPKVMKRMNELLKPEGLIISTTPCMGEKTFLSILLSLVSKIGLIPNIRSFKISELEDSIANGNFEIVETECLNQSGQQYFIAAKKILIT
ncbi:MAG: class I SAM-dependent methyltransferase [Candidatus Methanoperedens sp.]|nr:class I SAM-dependent methyltransferase [Candidatus Methanoperedens sp.]CAG0990950.1 demethylmenaquinone methyltransferase / 2-methoxy-6-polyprenyl-1,4-benzoquinol methylase [Methanosarcinales archaeon]